MNDFIDFSIVDSELKAYLIGFFYADATLSDYVISVRLSIKDKEHLEKLAGLLNKPTFEKDVKSKNGKIYKSIGFHICSKKSIDSLRKIGFIKNKTYQIDDVVFTNIPEELKRHFVRGFLDGDGTIFYSKWKDKKHNWNTTPRCNVGFVSYNSKILETIKNWLQKNLELKDKNIKSDKFEDEEKNEKYWRLIYSGNRISKKILDFLYDNSSIYMNRKYKEYLKIVEYKPTGYHYHTKSRYWRVPYKDEKNIQKWQKFKNEIDAQNFLQEIKNDPTYKVKENKPKGYYQNYIVEYKDEKNIRKHKTFKNEIEAQKFLQEIKNNPKYKAKDGYYHYWRLQYKDENNIKKWKNFKTEIEAQNFLQEIKNKNKIIKTYEKFISKMVK